MSRCRRCKREGTETVSSAAGNTVWYLCVDDADCCRAADQRWAAIIMYPAQIRRAQVWMGRQR